MLHTAHKDSFSVYSLIHPACSSPHFSHFLYSESSLSGALHSRIDSITYARRQRGHVRHEKTPLSRTLFASASTTGTAFLCLPVFISPTQTRKMVSRTPSRRTSNC